MCQWHAIRYYSSRRWRGDWVVSTRADAERLQVAAVEYRRWLVELEGRWVVLGGSPGALRRLVAEGRELEVARWVERAEAGW